MKNNPYVIAGALVVILVLIFGGRALSNKNASNQSGLNQNDGTQLGIVSSSTTSDLDSKGPIGGQRDGNGCLTGAGYAWDTEIGSCVRAWEKLTTFIPAKKWYFIQDNKVFSQNMFFTVDQNFRISGKICNSFSGTVKFDNRLNTVTSGPIMATEMACLDADISNLESKFFRIMNGTADVSLNTNTGRLTFKKGNDMVEFTTNAQLGATVVAPSPTASTASMCTNKGGQWSAEFRECTGIDSMACGAIGGKFNECASACRNDPQAQVCTMQCVQVCDFK